MKQVFRNLVLFVGSAWESPEVLEIRKHVMDRAMLPMLILAFPSCLSGMTQSLQQGRWILSVIYGLFYSLALVSTWSRTHLSFPIRRTVLLGTLFILSTTSLMRNGIAGGGLQGMTLVFLLGAVLGGMRLGLFILAGGFATATAIGLGMVSGNISVHPETMMRSYSPLAWASALTLFGITALGLALIPHVLVTRLKRSLALVEQHRKRLKRSNEILRGQIKTRKRVQRALKESEEKYRLVVDHATEYILLSQDGKVIFMNKRAMEESEYSAEDLAEKTVFEMVHPDDREEATNRYLRVMRGDEFGEDYEYRVLDRKGNTRWVRSHSVVVDWMAEPALLTFLTEITHQKKMEEEREKLRHSLERAQKMEALGTLAGGVAHDLNNVLSGIVAYPDLLLMQLPEDSPLRKPMMTIRESGKKAAAIVQDLLTLARRGVSVSEVVDLNEVIREHLRSAEHERLLSFHPALRIETHLADSILSIVGSPLHLQKTVMNLLSNAAEAMPDGGTVSISTGNLRVDPSLAGHHLMRDGDYVVLSVSDTGVGMSPEERDRIFEPFYTKKVMGRSGTGLGMSVVWGTIKDHNGHIDVQSAEGKGTTFSLYFPATRKEMVGRPPLRSGRTPTGNGESILVVDDMTEQRDIACTLLRQLGYIVDAVSSGQEAVEYVTHKHADLVILDMILEPGMDGLETYRQILKVRAGQKALLTSGYSETDRVKEARRLGAGAYIRKPYTIEVIGAAVRDELDRKEPAQVE
ncbi:MAG: ATP-binding protein [Thermodesulfobacteriota bacterium]